MAKVSIIITAHNYAKWLPQSLDSALAQSFGDFEVIVVDDGSTDHTPEILQHYVGRPNLIVVTTTGVGLAAASNRGIKASSGEYIVRLDADDYFDENLVLVLASYLDRNQTVGMVFCDYYTIDVHGELIDQRRRAKVNSEVELLDRPALAAGAMYRRKCWEAIGGYNEELRYQEDYDFWIKFIEKFQIRNVSVPLMYYRMHGASMSRNFEGRMQARREIKKRFVEAHRDRLKQQVLAIVPARADKVEGSALPLLKLGNSDLLEYAINTLSACSLVTRIIVSTEDDAIAQRARDIGADVPYLRSKQSGAPGAPFETAAHELLEWLRENEGYSPDILVLRYPHSPFLSAAHVTEAIDSLLLYNTDTVLAVMEDLTYHWQIGRNGLAPVGYQKRVVRQEKDLIFKEVGGLYVCRATNLSRQSELVAGRVGHIEVAPYDALRIESAYDLWVAKLRVDEATAWSP